MPQEVRTRRLEIKPGAHYRRNQQDQGAEDVDAEVGPVHYVLFLEMGEGTGGGEVVGRRGGKGATDAQWLESGLVVRVQQLAEA